MSYILGFDASQFQGTNISFPQVRAADYVFGFTRMTYAYPGQSIKVDPTAGKNYYGMVSAGILPGGYHKFGWTDPIAEADALVDAMSPLSGGDLLAHDMEPASDVPIPANWSEFEQAYVQRIHDRTGVWSIRYENIFMNNSMPKQGVVVNCPSWVAAPSYGWNDTVPVNTPVIIQQGPAVHIPGITANVCDTDAFFGEGTPEQLLAELRKLGYHAPTPPQEVSNATPQTQTPDPVPPASPQEPTPAAAPSPSVPAETPPAPAETQPQEPAPAPVPVQRTVPAPVEAPTPQEAVAVITKPTLLQTIIAFIRKLLHL